MRIISLVPSLTEFIADLGPKVELIGRTRFCVHPRPFIDSVPKMGGTKNPRIDKILAANPDLVIANREENRKEDISRLQEKCRVLVTDISDINSALKSMREIGEQTGTREKAEEICRQAENLIPKNPLKPTLKTAYLIWKKPWMTIGGDTYIHDVMQKWGLNNVFGDQKRYPEITLNEIKKQGTQLVLLSSEPYPFSEKHIPEMRAALGDVEIRLINGEWFSWYGSRMIPAFENLNRWRRELDGRI